MKRIACLLLVCVALSGCKILSGGQVDALRNSAVILEGGSVSNVATARILEKNPDHDPQVVRIFKQGAEREATVAASIRAIVGKEQE